jgi:hypothetical protein
MAYVDFVVTFEPPIDGFPIAAVDSPAGQVRSPLRLDAAGLLPRLREVGRQVRRSAADCGAQRRDLSLPKGSCPAQIGADLHRSLVAGEVRRLLETSRGIAAARGAGLRLRLKFDLSSPALAQLACLPWELLYDEAIDRFLARGDRRLLLVRSLSVPEFAPELGVEPPLRVLVAIANPVGLPALNLSEERRRISEALAGQGDIEISFLEDASLPDLRERLLALGCQVLHFMGHGRFDPKTGEGTLALSGEGRKPDLVTGQTLAQHLGDLGLRLVVLNACETADVAGGTAPDPFLGVAAALVRDGLPAAVAMQFPISDRAAILFSATFYRRLAAGDPVDVAVSEARLALQTAESFSLEWATPVVYLRVADSRLIVRPARPTPVRQWLRSLAAWLVPPSDAGWFARLAQVRVRRVPVGLWLAASLCAGCQIVMWFCLGLFLFGLRSDPWTLIAAIAAALFARQFGRVLPRRSLHRTAWLAPILACGLWLLLTLISVASAPSAPNLRQSKRGLYQENANARDQVVDSTLGLTVAGRGFRGLGSGISSTLHTRSKLRG